MVETDFLSRIEQEIKNSPKSILITTDSLEVHRNYSKIISKLLGLGLGGILVNLKNPSSGEKKTFEESGTNISKLYFIDCITVAADTISSDPDIHFLLNPSDLAGLNSNISSLCQNKSPNFIVIDLIDILLHYNSIGDIYRSIDKIKLDTFKSKTSLIVFISNQDKILFEKIAPLFDIKFSISQKRNVGE